MIYSNQRQHMTKGQSFLSQNSRPYLKFALFMIKINKAVILSLFGPLRGSETNERQATALSLATLG